MANYQKQPEVGHKFWKEGVGSGVISYVNFQFKELYVDFYEKGRRTYEFDEVIGNWEDTYGGTWMLYDEQL